MIDFKSILLSERDDKNADLTKKLNPTITLKVLGVKIPKIKKLAKLLIKSDLDLNHFLSYTPEYLEEVFLQGFVIAYLKIDIEEKIFLLKNFIPKIDNWAVCDSVCMAIKDFCSHPDLSLNFAKELILSKEVFAIRFGIIILLTYFSDKNFDISHILLVKELNSNEYYINMAIAWYISVLLVKQYDKVINIFERKTFNKWIHNKSIQKALESYRIEEIKKRYLKSLKIK